MAEREDAAEVSSESLAWADSCLIDFPDDSGNSNWENFRDALTEIIDIHPNMSVPSREEDMTESDSIHLRTSEPESISNSNSSSEQVSEIISLLTFESDPSENSLLESMAENKTVEPVNDPVLPRDPEGAEMIEDGESLSFQVFKDDFTSTSIQENAHVFHVSEDPVRVTQQEIFKVWDLEIVRDDDYEDDGLVLQLKKALNESSTVQPLNDELVVAEKSGIDDLIAGISDLSLAETFPSGR